MSQTLPKVFDPKVHKRCDKPCKRCGSRVRYITTRSCVTCATDHVARARLKKILGNLAGDI